MPRRNRATDTASPAQRRPAPDTASPAQRRPAPDTASSTQRRPAPDTALPAQRPPISMGSLSAGLTPVQGPIGGPSPDPGVLGRARAGIGNASRGPLEPRNSDGIDIAGSSAQTGRPAARALVIGCGALARELLEVTTQVPGLDVACLPPDLHNRPAGIPGAVRDRIASARREGYERIFIAYADCGTGGLLEPVLAEAGVERLPGAHCYEVFAGRAEFAALADAEPGTFWLTDFLARNFERLVIRGLGIDRHPELLGTYFANYTRVVFLSQTDDPDLLALAERAAGRLGLAFEHRPTGIAHFAAPILAFAERGPRGPRGAAAAATSGGLG